MPQVFDPSAAHTPPQLRDALQRCTTTATTPTATATRSTTPSTQEPQSSPPPLLTSRYVVFGSSIGLLAFFGAYGLGLRYKYEPYKYYVILHSFSCALPPIHLLYFSRVVFFLCSRRILPHIFFLFLVKDYRVRNIAVSRACIR